ncbi:lipid II flippase MurJ, partial [Actinomadura sp.]|uniref:lipid II flippase MurJ n=1 Tax=Actinomadura sp. TaxID=1989 RepID=UPI0037C60D11
MAVGTVFSRLTGFLRTVVIGAALGAALLGDAYQAAEMIPYTVYGLLLGGLLASVFVPFLVKRRMRDADGGAATAPAPLPTRPMGSIRVGMSYAS